MRYVRKFLNAEITFDSIEESDKYEQNYKDACSFLQSRIKNLCERIHSGIIENDVRVYLHFKEYSFIIICTESNGKTNGYIFSYDSRHDIVSKQIDKSLFLMFSEPDSKAVTDNAIRTDSIARQRRFDTPSIKRQIDDLLTSFARPSRG